MNFVLNQYIQKVLPEVKVVPLDRVAWVTSLSHMTGW